MDALELRTIRGRVGLMLGYDGPMWATHYARRLRVSYASVRRYLAGEREIPALVARRARELRDNPGILTAHERNGLGARRLQERRFWEKYRDRQAAKEQTSKPGDDVPF